MTCSVFRKWWPIGVVALVYLGLGLVIYRVIAVEKTLFGKLFLGIGYFLLGIIFFVVLSKSLLKD